VGIERMKVKWEKMRERHGEWEEERIYESWEGVRGRQGRRREGVGAGTRKENGRQQGTGGEGRRKGEIKRWNEHVVKAGKGEMRERGG
jgi:hypothetical protein